jgi:two-component system sensor histidine kinase RegB
MIANWTQDTVTIDILDNGPGITPGLHAKLGKTPVTTKEQGLGLGLFLAFTTVERLGGLVEMKPRISGGTCTTIQLPLLKHHA